LLVTQTGGMAAVAVTFGRYYREITRLSAGDGPIAAVTLMGLTAINCLGVRAGSNVQSALMLLKAAAIAAMVVAGILWGGGAAHPLPLLDRPVSLGLGAAIGAAMIPVAFAYGGWQTASFVSGEMRDPRRDLSRGLVMGVIGVVALYLAVNFVCLRVLGPEGLAATRIPASAVMRAALGERGARWIAFGIAVSTLGFLSQGILTAPRVYYAMARDGLFFKSVGWLSPKTGVPVVAIILQGVTATIIALSGRYEQILNYVISVDFISFGMTATSIFVFRRRYTAASPGLYLTPGHPYTTGLFVVACVAIVTVTISSFPANSAVGLFIMLAGIPVYLYWSRKLRNAPSEPRPVHPEP
jgi:APA family basic amino acid/polyamine antiporter